MHTVDYVIPVTVEAPLCHAPGWAPSARLVCPKQEQEEIAAKWKDQEIVGVDGFLDCHVLNAAVTQSEADYVCLIHPEVRHVSLIDRRDIRTMPWEEFHAYTPQWIALMREMGAKTAGAGFTGEWKAGVHEVLPFSTVQAVCPGVMLIQREGFRGFADMPYVEAAYDYQLRGLVAHHCQLRINYLSTSLRPETLAGELHQQTWGAKTVTPVFAGKKHGHFYRFKTGLSGV
jgi:hypothetical protein